MSSNQVPVVIQIMGNEYRVSCTEDKRESLLAAAEYLNEKMQEIRASGKVLGLDRVAVIAALNISHELLAYKQGTDELDDFASSRVQELLQKVETAVSKYV
jgi:cell division protein ZapA